MKRQFALFTVLLAAGCGAPPDAEEPEAAPAGVAPKQASDSAPNVLFVSIDTLRADVLGANGGFLPTDTLDTFAREGMQFREAHTAAPETAPSHATLFTGQEVVRHGVFEDGRILPADARTLAEAFREHGYDTAGILSNAPLVARFGWCQGFAHCDTELAKFKGSWPEKWRAFAELNASSPFDRRARDTTTAANAWLAGAREPFFLFVHYADPHFPRRPPERILVRTPRVGYDVEGRRVPLIGPVSLGQRIRKYHAEVQFVDRNLAKLRDAVAGASSRPVLTVVVGDHGEGLGQHHWLEHSANLYQELLHVPLIFHGPDLDIAPRTVDEPVSLVDVAPTIAELAGLEPLAEADGASLASSVRGASAPEPRAIVAQRVHTGEDGSRQWAFSLRFGSWKLIRSPAGRGGLFDLDSDPGETRDLSTARPDIAAVLAAGLDAWIVEHAGGAASP